jgi:hypothetical protein
MNHVCTCKNAKRSLMLFVPGLGTTYASVLAYCATDASWEAVPAENRLCVTLGECKSFQSVTEVVNFLRTLLDESLVRAIAAAWVDPMAPRRHGRRIARQGRAARDDGEGRQRPAHGPAEGKNASRRTSSRSSPRATWGCGATSASCAAAARTGR